MSLQAPKLDDRRFYDLLAEAKRLARERCPEWTDFSAGEPGTTLLELYAFLTEVMLYRVNRIPEKAYIEFLRLMGVRLAPPGAAQVALELRRSEGNRRRIEMPRGTRVSVARPAEGEEPPVFTTAEAIVLEPEQEATTVVAYHCRLVEAELLGVSSGLPGQSFQLRRAPVIASTGDPLDLIVAVKAQADEIDERASTISHGGQAFRVWEEVEHFSQTETDAEVYIVDRATGVVTFAPAIRGADDQAGNGLSRGNVALAAVPPAERPIRAWYRSGGGPQGNVAANTLTVLKDPVPGLRVNNPEAAVGGSEMESLDNALIRGPGELHSLNRAVTARDYEAVALREGSVARAYALAQAEHWQFAAPGTVQLLLVPEVQREPGEPCTREQLEAAQTQQARARVGQAVDKRRPLGTACVVDWHRYKPIVVQARLVVHAAEDAQAVQSRVQRRLYDLINPLGSHSLRRRLHASDVYHAALNEPGVLYAEQVRFSVDQSPRSEVESLAADPCHRNIWYAGAGDQLFRSMDSGGGWELLARFERERVRRIGCCPFSPGLVATVTVAAANESGEVISHVRLSEDCGQNWNQTHRLGFLVRDLAWLRRSSEPVLLLATDEGLFQLPAGSGPIPVLVDEHDQDMGLYAVTVSEVPAVGSQISVAARGTKGVYLCADEQLKAFHNIGLKGLDVRVLETQRLGPRAFLWAGLAATGGDEGEGCRRWELRRGSEAGEGWMEMSSGWRGGSCLAIACDGATVYATSFHAGVAHMDSARKSPNWIVPRIDAGLPLRDKERLLYRVDAVATAPRRGDEQVVVLAGGPHGVYRSGDGGETFTDVSATLFHEQVTVGEGYLFCSGQHQIEAVHDATSRH